VVGADQHGDIAGAHRLTLDGGAPGAAVGKHAVDRGNAGVGGEFAGVGGAVRLGVAVLEAPGRGGRAPQGDGRGGRAVAEVFVVAAGAARLHRVELDASVDERRIVLVRVGFVCVLRLLVERLDALQHGGA